MTTETTWLRELIAWAEGRPAEALAAAFYRASRLRQGSIPPRWEFTDPAIQAAFRRAAQRYFDGGDLIEPTLRMEPRYATDGRRLNDEWVEVR